MSRWIARYPPGRRHWRAHFQALDLPAERSRLLVTATGAAHARRVASADLAARVDTLAADCGVSRFMVMLAAYGAALAAASGASDIVIGTPTAGRPRPEVRTLIGCFVDLLPLRIDRTGNPSSRGPAGAGPVGMPGGVPRIEDYLRAARGAPALETGTCHGRRYSRSC